MARRSDELLVIRNVFAGYGPVTVIRDANCVVREGEVVGLVGRNGAGKTTLISAISGMLDVSGGEILLAGVDISGMAAHKRVQVGIAVVPSSGRLFRSLTVLENLGISIPKPRPRDFEVVFELFPELGNLQDRYAGNLSGGERQMVSIGRAILLQPKMLLLDEPTEGLAPIVVSRLVTGLRKLWDRGVATLIAEQNSKFTEAICQRHYLIEKGVIREAIAIEHSAPNVTAGNAAET